MLNFSKFLLQAPRKMNDGGFTIEKTEASLLRKFIHHDMFYQLHLFHIYDDYT